MSYLIAKTIHVLAIISWMAAMLYLPRLFLYHANTLPGSSESDLFIVMERRLQRAIMTPAMIVAWLAGLWLAISSNSFLFGWFHVKLTAVIILSAVHMWLCAERRRLESGRPRQAIAYRWINEIPTLLMVVIVAMVIVKPF